MNKTRLFIAKTPEIRNIDLSSYSLIPLQPGEQPHTLYRVFEHWGYVDPYRPDPNSPCYEPLVLLPDDAAYSRSLKQDIGATAGKYTIECVIEQYDKSLPYEGNYAVGVGGEYVFLDTSGQVSPSSSATTEPGTYIFDMSVNAANLQVPIIGNKFWIGGSGNAWNVAHPITNLGIKSVRIIKFSPTGESYDEVDTYDDFAIPVTYAVADVRDIGKKDSNWSLTVQLPNTNNNGQLFNCIHEITDYNSSFELLKEYPCFVEVDGNRTFSGFIQLTKVNINDDREVSYECNLHSNVIDFVKQLGNQTLRGNDDHLEDISFSEWREHLDNSSFNYGIDMSGRDEPSYTGHCGVDYGLTVIDKFDLSKKPFNLVIDSNPITTPSDYNHIRWALPLYYHQLTPFLFVKDIIHKIFAGTGYNLVSNFIDNDSIFPFSELAYPMTKTLPEASIDVHSIRDSAILVLGPDVTSSQLIQNYTPTSILHTTVNDYLQTSYISEDDSDPTIATHNSAYIFTAPRTGLYNINVNVPIIDKFAVIRPASPHNLITQATQATFYNDGAIHPINTVRYYIKHYLVKQHNGVYTQLESITYDNTISRGESITLSGGISTSPVFDSTLNYDGTVYLEIGDEIKIRSEYYCDEYDNSINEYYFRSTPSILGYDECVLSFITECMTSQSDEEQINISLASELASGGIFDPTVILNPETKKIDFLNSIIKKFNLYIEDVSGKQDLNGTFPYPEKTLRIEPRDEYYGENMIVRDWTDRVDVSTIKFNRLDEYVYDVVRLKDLATDDYFDKEYNDWKYNSGEWGEKVVGNTLASSDIKDTKIETIFGQCIDIKVGFTQSASYNNWNYFIPFGAKSNDLIVPEMLFFDGEHLKEPKTPDVVLYRNFYKTSETVSPYYAPSFILLGENNDFNLQTHLDDNIIFRDKLTDYVETRQYNRLSMFDLGGMVDLNFGKNEWYYVSDNDYLMPTCYDLFYKKMLDNYNNQNSRLVTCRAYLYPTDIANLQLSDTIIVNSIAYHINKIKEWSSISEPCELELIRIIDSKSVYGILPSTKTSSVHNAITPVSYSPQIATLSAKMMEVNKSIESGNVSITELKKMISDIDARLKKLESGK